MLHGLTINLPGSVGSSRCSLQKRQCFRGAFFRGPLWPRWSVPTRPTLWQGLDAIGLSLRPKLSCRSAPQDTCSTKQAGSILEAGSEEPLLEDLGANASLTTSTWQVMPHPTHRVVTDDIGWGLCAGSSGALRPHMIGPIDDAFAKLFISRRAQESFRYSEGRACGDESLTPLLNPLAVFGAILESGSLQGSQSRLARQSATVSIRQVVLLQQDEPSVPRPVRFSCSRSAV